MSALSISLASRAAAIVLCLGTLASGSAARAQATQNDQTQQSLPLPASPTPTSDRPDATGSHPPASSVNAPPSGVRPGSTIDKENSGITVLPYEGKPVGTATITPPPNGSAQIEAEARSDRTEPQLLDRVVAIINGDVILASDVQEEQHFAPFEPYAVPGGQFTPLEAMQHIVSRTLILQQMKEQRMTQPPADEVVNKEIDELRKQIPACAQYHCETDAGWRTFLAGQGFTEAQLQARWKQRMQILQFIQVRFRSGIRISEPEIQDYYNKNLVPEFAKRKLPPPPLARVSARIDEVLLQQRVNLLLNDWLKSLKDSGNVAILDPAFSGIGGKNTTNDAGDDDDDSVPGGTR